MRLLPSATTKSRSRPYGASNKEHLPFDYVTKMPNIAVPDYAVGGESLAGAPAVEAGERARAINLLRSIFSPGAHAAPRRLGWLVGCSWKPGRTEINLFLEYIGRILGGRYMKRATFLYSPGACLWGGVVAGGNRSQDAIEALLRNVLGPYAQCCGKSIFPGGQKLDELNCAISPIRESARFLTGQEVGADSPWRDTTSMRRADCSRCIQRSD